MSENKIKIYSKNFGKKEKVLNYACQTYHLSRPDKVGAVMALIRKCQPKSFEKWEAWYFQNAFTESTDRIRITSQVLKELGERLYVKIKEIVIPEWTEAFNQLSQQDCIDYIYNLTINRTYDGFLREKSVVVDANFGNYSPSERMKASFADFEEKYGGKVFLIISLDGEVGNKEIIEQIKNEVKRLKNG